MKRGITRAPRTNPDAAHALLPRNIALEPAEPTTVAHAGAPLCNP
jgi:hypothetical protein